MQATPSPLNCCQAGGGAGGFADAAIEPAGLGVSPRLHGAGGQVRCGSVSVLQAGALAGDSSARQPWAIASANTGACARMPGAAVTARRRDSNKEHLTGPFDVGQGGGSCPAALLAGFVRPGACCAPIGPADWCAVGWANLHTEQIYRHNLRMTLRAKLTSPFGPNPFAFGAALQSNKVYPPRLSPLPATGIAARRINAIR